MSSNKKKKPVTVNLFLQTARELATGQPAPKQKTKKKVKKPTPNIPPSAERRTASSGEKDKPSSKANSSSLKERRSKRSEENDVSAPVEETGSIQVNDTATRHRSGGPSKDRKRSGNDKRKKKSSGKKNRQHRSRPAEDSVADGTANVGEYPKAAVAPDMVPDEEIEAPAGYPLGPEVDDDNENDNRNTAESYNIVPDNEGTAEHPVSEVEQPRDEEEIEQGRPSKKKSSKRRKGKNSKRDRHREDRHRRHHVYGEEELVEQSSGMISVPKQDEPIYPNNMEQMHHHPPPLPLPLGEPVMPLSEHGRSEYLAAEQHRQEQIHQQNMMMAQRNEEMPMHAYPHGAEDAYGNMQRHRSRRRSKSRSRGDGLRRSKSKRNRRPRERYPRHEQHAHYGQHGHPEQHAQYGQHVHHEQHAPYDHHEQHAQYGQQERHGQQVYHREDVAPIVLSRIIDDDEGESDHDEDNGTQEGHVAHRSIGIAGEEGGSNAGGSDRIEAPAPTPDENDGSDGTAPSGGEESPHEEELERARRSSKAKRKKGKGKGNGRKRGSKEKGSGSLEKSKSRAAKSMMSDAETLDNLSARRAQEVMKKAKGKHDGEPTVTLGILERFLPGRKVPGAQTAAERAEEEGFLELPEMGENESMAHDALVRDAAKARSSIFRVEVPQNFSYIVERRAKYNRRIDAGWHTLMPFIDKVSRVHSMRNEPMTIPQHQSFTRDSVPVHTAGVLFVQITDPVAASYAVDNPYRSLLLLAQACVSNMVGKFTLRQAVVNRPDIGRKLTEEINDTARSWGLWVCRVEITQLEPPPETRALLQLEAEARLQEEHHVHHIHHIYGRGSSGGNDGDDGRDSEMANIYSNHNIHDGTDSMGTETIERELQSAGIPRGTKASSVDMEGSGRHSNRSNGNGNRGETMDTMDTMNTMNTMDTVNTMNTMDNSNSNINSAHLHSDRANENDMDDVQSSHAAASVLSAATSYDPFLDDSLSDQAALGASWFTGATANTRKPPPAPSSDAGQSIKSIKSDESKDSKGSKGSKRRAGKKAPKDTKQAKGGTAAGKPPKMPTIKV